MAQSAKRAQGRVEELVLRRIREVMAGRRTSQVELSERVGLSRTQLTRILNGHKPASFTEMVHIAAALDLDLSALVAQAEEIVTRTGDVPTSARVDMLILDADLAERERASGGATHPQG